MPEAFSFSFICYPSSMAGICVMLEILWDIQSDNEPTCNCNYTTRKLNWHTRSKNYVSQIDLDLASSIGFIQSIIQREM